MMILRGVGMDKMSLVEIGGEICVLVTFVDLVELTSVQGYKKYPSFHIIFASLIWEKMYFHHHKVGQYFRAKKSRVIVAN